MELETTTSEAIASQDEALPAGRARFPWAVGALGLADQALVSLGNFVCAALVARAVGVAGLGEYSLAFAVLVFVINIQEALVAAPYTYFCHRLKGNARPVYAGSTLTTAAVGAVLAAALLSAAGWLLAAGLGVSIRGELLAVFAVALPCVLARELARRMALAHLHVGTALAISAGATLLNLPTLALLAATERLTTERALLTMAASSAATAAVWLWSWRHSIHIRVRRVGWHTQVNLAYGGWLCAGRITSVLHGQLLPWLLGTLVGLEAVGGFSAALGIMAAANPILMGFINTFSPYACAAALQGREHLRHVVRQATCGLTAGTLAFAVCLDLFGSRLLAAVYGAEFAAYGALVGILALAMVSSAAGAPADHGLRAIDRSAVSFRASIIGLAATALLAAVFIPTMQLTGAAWSLVGGCMVATLVRGWVFVEASSEVSETLAACHAAGRSAT